MIDDKDSTDSTLRALLWQALRNYSSAELMKLIRDSDYIVRTAAAKQLHFRPEIQVFDEVLELCLSPVEYEREISAFILGQIGTPHKKFREKSVPYLLDLIKDNSASVRASAAAALGHLYCKDMPIAVEKSLFDAAKDVEPSVRCDVACALGGARNVAQAEKILLEMLLDDEEAVREYAELGLDILLDR